MEEEFQYPFEAGTYGLAKILIQCCFTSWPSLDGSSSHSFLLSSVWIEKILVNEWMNEWTENLKTKHIFKR